MDRPACPAEVPERGVEADGSQARPLTEADAEVGRPAAEEGADDPGPFSGPHHHAEQGAKQAACEDENR
jgi:hypothetical protein